MLFFKTYLSFKKLNIFILVVSVWLQPSIVNSLCRLVVVEKICRKVNRWKLVSGEKVKIQKDIKGEMQNVEKERKKLKS